MGLRAIRQGSVEMAGVEITDAPLFDRSGKGLVYVPADRRGVGSVATLNIEDNAILGNQRQFSGAGSLLRDRAKSRSHAETLIDRFGVRTPGISFSRRQIVGWKLAESYSGSRDHA